MRVERTSTAINIAGARVEATRLISCVHEWQYGRDWLPDRAELADRLSADKTARAVRERLEAVESGAEDPFLLELSEVEFELLARIVEEVGRYFPSRAAFFMVTGCSLPNIKVVGECLAVVASGGTLEAEVAIERGMQSAEAPLRPRPARQEEGTPRGSLGDSP